MFKVKARSLARRAIKGFAHASNVIRMHALEYELRRGGHRPVVAENAEGFRRPNQFSTGHPAAKAAREAQSLRLRQVGLASPQFLFRPLAVGNVRRNAAGQARLPSVVQTEHSALVNPPDGPARLDDSILNVVIAHLPAGNPA